MNTLEWVLSIVSVSNLRLESDEFITAIVLLELCYAF